MVNFPSLDPTTLRLPDAVRAQIAADLKDNTQTEGAAIAELLSGVGSGNYTKPAGGIPETDLAAAVQTTLGKADSALQVAPVTSVAGKTGVVALAAADVGLSNVDNTSDAAKPVSDATQAALDAQPQYLFWNGTAWDAGRAASSMWVFFSGGQPNAATPNGGTHAATWIPDKNSPVWASL